MPVNRLTRDNILIQALDQADLPELDHHDRPSVTIVNTAFSINWLQRALDTIHQEFPWAGTITKATGTIASGVDNVASFAPADFILDVRDAFFLTVENGRAQLRRAGAADLARFQAQSAGVSGGTRPTWYAFTGRKLLLNATTDKAYAYTLWYYQLPAILAAADTPNFPSDHTLVDYIVIRALEWGRKLPPGSAMKYLREVEIPALRAAGLDQEPESDYIPLDPRRFGSRGGRDAHDPTAWMG